MPYARHLGNGLHELRLDLNRDTISQRITYMFDHDHAITLTTFPKTKDNEQAEIDRARQARTDYLTRKDD